MKNLGKVVEIFSAKKGQSGLPRPKVDKLEMIENYGIKEDKFALLDSQKEVMIVGTYAYDLALKNKINLEYGSLGENILLEFNPHDYKIASKFQIGEAIIEITQNCTICKHLNVFDKKLPFLLRKCRGVYCKVIKAGLVTKDSKVILLDEKINLDTQVS